MKNETHETMSALSNAVNKMDDMQRKYIEGVAAGLIARKEGLGDAQANNK